MATRVDEPRTTTVPAGTHTVMAVTEGPPATVSHFYQDDPHDEWGARDLLLSMVPFMVATAMRDTSFNGGLIFATAWAWGLLIYRFAFWDGKRKFVLPAVDICNCVLFPILLGTAYYDWHALHKWYNIIAQGALAITMLLSVAAMRPFTGHYARYARADKGGRSLWQGDVDWRNSCRISSIIIGVLFAIVCLLSLIPVETDHYNNFSALNIIFNYIFPLVVAGILAPIVLHMICGKMYKRKAANSKRPVGTMPATGTAYVGSPV